MVTNIGQIGPGEYIDIEGAAWRGGEYLYAAALWIGAISQQMFCFEYWDYTDQASVRYPTHRPMFLRIRQTSYAWSNTGANEFVGFDYRSVNEGFETLRQVYKGMVRWRYAGGK